MHGRPGGGTAGAGLGFYHRVGLEPTAREAGRIWRATVKISTFAFAAPALLVATALAAPAPAQNSDDIVVMGRYGHVPADAESLSMTVSYADLDLSKAWARTELRHRISLTARYLCDKLGESDTAGGATPTCRDVAAQKASVQVDEIAMHWPETHSGWAGGPAWHAPYSEEWAATHSRDGGYSGGY
jgi:UrcA family protein